MSSPAGNPTSATGTTATSRTHEQEVRPAATVPTGAVAVLHQTAARRARSALTTASTDEAAQAQGRDRARARSGRSCHGPGPAGAGEHRRAPRASTRR